MSVAPQEAVSAVCVNVVSRDRPRRVDAGGRGACGARGIERVSAFSSAPYVAGRWDIISFRHEGLALLAVSSLVICAACAIRNVAQSNVSNSK